MNSASPASETSLPAQSVLAAIAQARRSAHASLRGTRLSTGLGATLTLFLLAMLPVPIPANGADTSQAITLEVDAREAPRRIFHSRLVFPVKPGPLTLVFPKWLPGMHAPAGQVRNVSSLRFTIDDRSIPWQRDAVDLFSFRCQIPDGAERLEVIFDFLADSEEPRHSTAATANLATISWETLVFYPEGLSPDALTYAVRLRLPPGWKFATALPLQEDSGAAVMFSPVSLVTLIDSPVIAGRHFKTVPLASGTAPAHALHMVADSAAALAIRPGTAEGYSRLVTEGLALFGSPHYRRYDFLLTLSDRAGSGGLEHHESSDNRLPERSLIDEDRFESAAGLLPHEFVHSWNGKYRRPSGLVLADYQQPMRDELLWIYEGLTSYLGSVLTARSGLVTPEQARGHLAAIAADLEHTPGRAWRTLTDTAIGTALPSRRSNQWGSSLRGRDFYPEGILIWLEADVTIRRQTEGRHSLDDFCRRFFGGQAGPPEVNGYELADVIAALNEFAPRDWAAFFDERVNRVTTSAPLGGIEAGGWRLAYHEKPSSSFKAAERKARTVDLAYSIGLRLSPEGQISDVIAGMAADKAGLAPGMRLVAVNGREFSPERLRDEVAASNRTEASIRLTARDGEFFSAFELDYHGGARCPALVRNDAEPDILSEILKPTLTAPPAGDDALDALVLEEMARQHIPGVSIAVLKRGEIVKARGYGLANLEHDIAAKPETVYQIQSITKTFTATAILMLVEEGKIDLDAKVGVYLDGTPESWKDISIRQLLSHTSGIKDFINEPTASLRLDVTEDEVFKATIPRPLNFTPGEKYAYSNTNYHLLAMIIRKLTGKSYGEFLHERVFDPLGMNQTAIISWSDLIPNRAAGYRWYGNALHNGQFIAPSVLGYGGGGIRSTVLDMARYDAALYTDRLVKRAMLEQMWTPARFNNGQAGGYGFGWSIGNLNGHRCVSHTGAHSTGFTTMFERFPDDGWSFVVFTNRQGVDIGRLTRLIEHHYLAEIPAPGPPATRPAGRPRRPGPLSRPR